uniref:SXP/RAL-2 family protein Ani s 5-like cation-binding domain-containing protein n=1 Tax=Meloidogyne javanica TaxID=6303 RepID=A0A915LEM3_MELJA
MFYYEENLNNLNTSHNCILNSQNFENIPSNYFVDENEVLVDYASFEGCKKEGEEENEEINGETTTTIINKEQEENKNINFGIKNIKIVELQQLLAGGENLTKKIFNEQMDKWASEQSDYFYSCYEEMKEGFYDAKEILDERHDQLMSNQTAEVKDADKRIREINNNQNITMKQESDQINQLINSLPQNVAQTIIQLAPYQALNSNNNNANT